MTISVRRARKEDAATVSAMCLALNEDEAVPGRRASRSTASGACRIGGAIVGKIDLRMRSDV